MNTNEAWLAFKKRLAQSKFRSSFRLGAKELRMIAEKGMDEITLQCGKFIRERLADAVPQHDGRQTPMRGHPCFIAQHATGCCCRGCLSRWHGIPSGRALTEPEIEWIVFVLSSWIREHAGEAEHIPHTPDLFR